MASSTNWKATLEASPVPNDANPPRVVIDENSFNFRGLTSGRLSSLLDRFNEALTELRSIGCPAWKPPTFENVLCDDEYELYAYMTSKPGGSIDRDVRNRFYSLIQKCPELDVPISICKEITLGDEPPATGCSVAYALALVLNSWGVSCLVLGSSPHRDFVTAIASAGRAKIYFFTESSTLPPFWRSLYELENIREDKFFELAERAFPKLVFHEDLAFGKFEGPYRDLRPEVVRHLAVLNDHFLAAHATALGRANEIQAALATYGLARVSPESPKTHRNAKAMRQRYVQHQGREICCEWHTKIEGHRNRIHFAFGGELEDRILIGIFVDHLITGRTATT
jgi:hypothetical protein